MVVRHMHMVMYAGPGVWRIKSFPVDQVEKWSQLGVSLTEAGEDSGYLYTKVGAQNASDHD